MYLIIHQNCDIINRKVEKGGKRFEQGYKQVFESFSFLFRFNERSFVLYCSRYLVFNNSQELYTGRNRFYHIAVAVGMYSTPISDSFCNQEDWKHRIRKNGSIFSFDVRNFHYFWKTLLPCLVWQNLS